MQNRVLVLGGRGYIGSRVNQQLIDSGHETYSIDLGWFENYVSAMGNLITDFSKLDGAFIRSFKSVILLAGHASFQMCEEDPHGSYLNNVMHFVDLLGKVLPEQRFIYASSASVYGISDKTWKESDSLPAPGKIYDRQKQMIDAIADRSGKNFYALRFGTVCGYSPNGRSDLMINSMTLCAQAERCVEVTNADSFRAVLGMNDVCNAIQRIVEFELDASGVYNLSSFNATIGEIGERVAKRFDAKLVNEAGGGTYSFKMDTTKFQETFNFEFKDTVESIATGAANNDITAKSRSKTGIRYV